MIYASVYFPILRRQLHVVGRGHPEVVEGDAQRHREDDGDAEREGRTPEVGAERAPQHEDEQREHHRFDDDGEHDGPPVGVQPDTEEPRHERRGGGVDPDDDQEADHVDDGNHWVTVGVPCSLLLRSQMVEMGCPAFR